MPTKDKDERPAVEHTQTGKLAKVAVDRDVSEHRRKIIKASAAAVPAIMTLRSGAAAAMASTYNCTARDNKAARNETTAPDFVLEARDGMLPHDTWVRVPGKRVEANPPGSGNATTIVYCVETGSGGSPSSPTWQCFNEDGTDYQGNLPVPAINDGDDVALLAFLKFNAYGDDTGDNALFYPMIQTVTEAPPGPSPLTGSCLASIHPNLNLLGDNLRG
jgi:hypothetical protein